MEIVDYLGTVPCNEECAQTGGEGYTELARIECRVYKNQIVRMFGEPPAGVVIKPQWESHDFGRYAELVVGYELVWTVEIGTWINIVCEELPGNWDDEAKAELEASGYTAKLKANQKEWDRAWAR